MRRPVALILLGVVCWGVGIATGAWLFPLGHSARADDVIAMAWGDGKYGKAFYGAQVYAEPTGSRFTVRARIHIGHGNGMFQDCGVLGTEDTFEEAVEKWGRIEWRADGLHIGSYFVSRSEVEAHR